jgi:hypothetical protein
MNIKELILQQANILAIAIIVSAIMFFSFGNKKSEQIVTIDLDHIYRDFIGQTAKKNLSKVEYEGKVESFTSLLNEILEDLTSQDKVIIIPAKSVLYGSAYGNRDITFRIKKEIEASYGY